MVHTFALGTLPLLCLCWNNMLLDYFPTINNTILRDLALFKKILNDKDMMYNDIMLNKVNLPIYFSYFNSTRYIFIAVTYSLSICFQIQTKFILFFIEIPRYYRLYLPVCWTSQQFQIVNGLLYLVTQDIHLLTAPSVDEGNKFSATGDSSTVHIDIQ